MEVFLNYFIINGILIILIFYDLDIVYVDILKLTSDSTQIKTILLIESSYAQKVVIAKPMRPKSKL